MKPVSGGLGKRGHALPSHSSNGDLVAYSKTDKRRPQRDGRPWFLMLVLLLGAAGAYYSWSSSAGALSQARRGALQEPDIATGAAGADAEAQLVAEPHGELGEQPGVLGEQQEGSDEALEVEQPAEVAGDVAPGGQHHVRAHEWSERRISEVAAGEGGLSSQPAPHDDQAAEAPPFNEALHQMYLDLPRLDPVPAAIYAGGWQLTQAVYNYAVTQPMAEVVSWENPRLAVFRNFLSPPEVEHMINISIAQLVRSEVLSGSDSHAIDRSRTSYGTWPDKEDAVLRRISERIHRLLSIPERFGEDIYVLNYKPGQKYEGHNDHVMDGSPWKQDKVADAASRAFLERAGGPDCGPGAGGPSCGDRVATFILTLKSAARGGATVFPEADATKAAVGEGHPQDHHWYCKTPGVLGIKGHAGDALLFWDYAPSEGSGTGSYSDGSADPAARPIYAAMHSGCPVLEGEKFIATRWIRGAGFDYRGEDLEV
eukprot:scaffold3.g6415.t1